MKTVQSSQEKFRKPLKWLVLLFLAMLVFQQAPGMAFSFVTNYSRNHPLLVEYYTFMRIVNICVAAALILSLRPAIRAFLFRLMTALFVFEFISAFWLMAIERDSMYAYRLSSLHMWMGQVATPLFVAYLIGHLYKWSEAVGRREALRSVGLTALMAIPILMGAIWSVLGGPELLPLLAAFHAYPSWILPVLAALHIKASKMPAVREKRRKDLPSDALRFGPRLVAGSAIFSFFLMLLPAFVVWKWIVLPADNFLIERLDFLKPPVDPPKAIASKPDYPSYEEHGPFYPSNAKVEGGGFIDPEYFMQADSCGYMGCHVDITAQWKQSAHRRSISPFFKKVRDAYIDAHGVEESRLCAACHDPTNLLAGNLHRNGETVPDEKNEGITCTVCHTIDKTDENAFNGGYSIRQVTDFFERKVDSGHYLLIVSFLDNHKADFKRALYKDNNYCAACHNFMLPARINVAHSVQVNFSRDWQNSSHSRPDSPTGVQTCNQCHLPMFMEQYQARLAKSHQFLSSNTAVPWFYGDKEQLEATQNLLRSGVVELSASLKGTGDGNYRPGDQAEVEVVVNNLGVGHGFPAGLLNLVQAWVEIEVANAKGLTVWSAGALDAGRQIPEDTLSFGANVYNENGQILTRHQFWEIGEIRNARRLLGGEKTSRLYSFTIPYGETEPLKLTARLRHRRFKPDFVDWALDKSGVELPITDMAVVELDIPLEGGVQAGASKSRAKKGGG